MPKANDIFRRLIETEDELAPLKEPAPVDPSDAQAPEDAETEIDIKADLSDLLDKGETNTSFKGSGRNELYSDLKRILDRSRNKKQKKVDNNTWVIDNEEFIAVKLYYTDVIRAYPDGRVEVDTGGHETVTTRDRINNFVCYAGGWRVYQKNYGWYWYNSSTQQGTFMDDYLLPFNRHDSIDPDGTLQLQEPAVFVRKRKRKTGA